MKVDILIAGDGPAGCAAAITALQAGRSVLLFHADKQDRHLPGETLHPGAEPLLKKLGVWDEVLSRCGHRHTGLWRQTICGARTFAAYGSDKTGPWAGLQMDRQILSRILKDQVASLGGVSVKSPRLLRLAAEDGTVLGIDTDDACFRAGFTLDATGRSSWMARQLGLEAEKRFEGQRLRFGWSKGDPPELEGQPLFQERDDGWNWLAPLGNNRTAWVKLRSDPSAKGIDFTWKFHRECAGPGYFLLGDAACLMDPSAANGVLRAMMSGIHAAFLANAVASNSLGGSEAAIAYRVWMAGLFQDAVLNLQPHL